MPTAPQPDPAPSGSGNLFLDADPIDDYLLAEPDGTSKPTPQHRRSRSRVVAVDRPPPIAAATSRTGRAASFTRPNTGIDRLRGAAMERVRGLAVLAGRPMSRVAARPYAPLALLGAFAGVLIALGWFGLELGDASAGRSAAEQRLAAATTTLNHDRARIDALSAQLHQATLNARRQQTTETAAPAPRPRPEHKPARGPRRRH
jgi:hypothetical protein